MSYRVKRLLRNLALVPFFAAIAVTSLSTTGAVADTSARTRQEHDIFYYTDATYTVQCGYKIYPCYGGIHQSGCVTAFIYDEWYDCFAGGQAKTK